MTKQMNKKGARALTAAICRRLPKGPMGKSKDWEKHLPNILVDLGLVEVVPSGPLKMTRRELDVLCKELSDSTPKGEEFHKFLPDVLEERNLIAIVPTVNETLKDMLDKAEPVEGTYLISTIPSDALEELRKAIDYDETDE